jgi:hypothetical protein
VHGLNVGVVMVEVCESNEGKRQRKQLEVDCVATEGNRKYFIQMAQDMNTPEMENGEECSLLRIRET